MKEVNLYSRYIEFVLRWLNASDVTVNVHAFHLPEGILGRYYDSRDGRQTHIDLNVPTAREALLTLAHEAGHWLGNEVSGYKKHSYQRERQAVVYGWRVLGLVGAQHLVTRAEWMNFHKEDTPDGKSGDEVE